MTAVTDKAVVSLGCRASTGVDCMHRVLGFVPVQLCWSAAKLSGVQNLIGVTAVTNKAVASLGCRASIGVGSMHRVLGIMPVQQGWSAAKLSGVQNLIGVTVVTNKAVVSLGCRASTGVDSMHRVWACACATGVVKSKFVKSRVVWSAKAYGCDCSHRQGCCQFGLQS